MLVIIIPVEVEGAAGGRSTRIFFSFEPPVSLTENNQTFSQKEDLRTGSWKVLSGSGNWPKYNAEFGKKYNAKCLDRIWDLTAFRESGFAKIVARDAVLGKKTVFGIQARDGRDAGLSWKRSGNAGSGPTLPYCPIVGIRDLTNIQRYSGKCQMFWRIRDFTDFLEAGFAKILAQDAVLGKKTFISG